MTRRGYAAGVVAIVTPTDAAIQVRPLLRVEYDQLVLLGVFDDERIELLEGVLVPMSPESIGHATIIEHLNELFVLNRPRHLNVRVGSAWAASDRSEPEPDIALVPARRPHDEHPTTAALLIEVSWSSRRKDLGPKAAIYAAAGVPEYWVVDLTDRVVVRHYGPTPDGYMEVTRHGAGEVLDGAGVAVDVTEVFAAAGDS